MDETAPDHLRICNEVLSFVESLACGRDRNISIEMKTLPSGALVPLIDEWLFTFPWTEALLGADDMVRRNAANHIAHLVLSTAGAGAVIHDVSVAPPMWYATFWRDVAIEGSNGRFLLSAQFDD